jgi:hypothetical protein
VVQDDELGFVKREERKGADTSDEESEIAYGSEQGDDGVEESMVSLDSSLTF